MADNREEVGRLDWVMAVSRRYERLLRLQPTRPQESLALIRVTPTINKVPGTDRKEEGGSRVYV